MAAMEFRIGGRCGYNVTKGTEMCGVLIMKMKVSILSVPFGQTMKGTLKSYNAIRGANCTTVCREILNKFTNLNSQAISPSAFWPDVFFKFARPDQLNQPLPRTKGQDYGNPRPGISTYELVWRLLQMNSPAPQEQVTSKICFSGEDGKQVCN